MTIQTKHFIELSDILALRFVCKYCDASLSVPLSDEKLRSDTGRNRFLGECPSCHRNWANVNGSTHEPSITRLAAALNRLRDTLSTVEQIGLKLSLEIRPDAVPPGNHSERVP